jgi:hypothetical protein
VRRRIVKFIEVEDKYGKALLLEEHVAQVGYNENGQPNITMKDGSTYDISQCSLQQVIAYLESTYEIIRCASDAVALGGGWK